jgi:uncharacterized protein
MKAFAIDAFDFCRLKEHAEGEVDVAELSRLLQECADASGALHWTLQGGADQAGHSQLELAVSGSVRLLCQRCLTPFGYDIAARSVLILAPDEESADKIEELLADDSVDVIVGSRRMDIIALVEDEALLALPAAARHDVCPDPETVNSLESLKKPSPFSVLKNLK